MKVLIAINSQGQEYAIVSNRAAALRGYIAEAKRNGKVWRYHDGNGWADGSEESWRHIQSVTGTRTTTIAY